MDPDAAGGNEWRDPDTATCAAEMLAFLDALSALPEIAAAKARSFSLLHARPGCRVLDAGCGTGTDLGRLAEIVLPGGSIVGIDTSAAALASAPHRPGIGVTRGDLAALPFADDSFDGVRSDRVLQHVADPQEVIHELVRVARPGAAIVVSEVRFTVPGGQRSGGRRRGPPGLTPFLPLLFDRAGVVEIRLDHTDSEVGVGAEIAAVVGVDPGPLTVRMMHVAGTVT